MHVVGSTNTELKLRKGAEFYSRCNNPLEVIST